MGLAAATARTSIVKASVSRPEELNAEWRATGSVLQEAAVVEDRHLVLVFSVDHASSIIGAGIPRQLTKYTDHENHAPYRAKCLKLATLRHYRAKHQHLEGTWDPMEGRTRISSTFAEFCERHSVQAVTQGTRFGTADVTYQTDDTGLIYCTSRAMSRASRHEQWRVASRIRDVPKFALLLGAEFARQCDEGRHRAVTVLDRLAAAGRKISGWNSVVQVHHGPVVYDDDAGEVLFARMPEHARGGAAHFFKRTEFEDQHEYRFVVSASGGRPIEDEFFLRITPEMRPVFGRP